MQTNTRHRDEEAKIAKPHGINKTIKVKQPALFSSEIIEKLEMTQRTAHKRT